jgi:hypothetical protein
MDRVVLFDNNGQIIQTLEIDGQGVQPDYLGFYNGLLVSLTYRSVVQMPATAELARALAIFVSAMQDAMAGRVNPGAMQGAIWLLLGQVALTEAHAVELSALMTTHHLSSVYLLSPP